MSRESRIAQLAVGIAVLVALGGLVMWGGDGGQVDPREQACAAATAAAAQGDVVSADRLAAECSSP